MAQWRENLEFWAFPWGGKKPEIYFRWGRLPKGLISVLPESRHKQEKVSPWELLRTKVSIWTSLHLLTIVPPPGKKEPSTPGFSLRRENVGWCIQSSSFSGAAQRTGFCFVYSYVLMGPNLLEVPRGATGKERELRGLQQLPKACNTAKLILLRGLSLEERWRVEFAPNVPNFKTLQSYSN